MACGCSIKRGIDPLKDVKPVTLKGHDQSLIALLNGDVDAAVVFQDARNIVKKIIRIYLIERK